MAWGRRRPEPAPQQGWDDPMWVPQPVEQWITPEEVADRLRRRRARWRALRHGVVLLLVITLVGGTGVLAAGAVLGRWALPSFLSPSSGEPTAAATAPVVECEPAQVQVASAQGTSVSVLNGTTRPGLAGSVADELEARGFSLVDVGNAPRELEPAVVRYPPDAESAAYAVWVHLQDAVMSPDASAEVVTVVLGDTWAGVATLEDVRVLAVEPQPSRVSCADGTAGTPAQQEPGPGSSPAPSG
jgi:hypothetical protein